MLMHSLINCQAQVKVKWFDVVKNIYLKKREEESLMLAMAMFQTSG